MQIVMVLFFICFVFAYICLQLIGKMQSHTLHSVDFQNYDELKYSVVIFFALSNYDSYPDSIELAYSDNSLNIIIFLVFITINVLFV